MRWFVGLGWLTAAYSAAVLVWMLLADDHLVHPVVWTPSLVFVALVPVCGLLGAVFPRRFRGGLKHPNRHQAAAVTAAAALLVSVLIAMAMTPYRGEPADAPTTINVQRGLVGVVLFVNLVALVGAAGIASDRPEWFVPLPRGAKYSGVRVRRRL